MNELVRASLGQSLAALHDFNSDVKHQYRLSRMRANTQAVLTELDAAADVARAAKPHLNKWTVRALRTHYFGKL